MSQADPRRDDSVSTSSTIAPSTAIPTPKPAHHLLADVYTFNWSALSLHTPLLSASAVALCLSVGLALGHPGGALIAAGGALTVGFGVNQRIADSRVLPMLLGVVAISTATLAGTMVGHHGYAIVLASIASAAIYAVLTLRNAGQAWVGQQASVALFVASAFPSAPRGALVRFGLIAAGGIAQTLITTLGLHLLPDLRRDLSSLPRSLFRSIAARRRSLLHALAHLPTTLPEAVPAPSRPAALLYAGRLMLTVALATELYRRLGLQSGYWIPMTALLVQRPALAETFTRALLRVAGTLAGAVLSTLLVTHLPVALHAPQTIDWTLAAFTTFFAFCAFATNAVNYGLFALCLTSYIVFLLSLNAIPGPEIAHRRALATIAGAAIALLLHLDALRRHTSHSAQP